MCTPDAGCVDGFTCEPVGESMICVPESALVGEECMENADCASGLCAIGTASGNVCTRFCDGGELACASGFECVRISGGRENICLPAGGNEPASGGGCNVAIDRSSGTPLALGFGFLLAFVWRRRTR
jgi:hypothetical protein